MVFRYLWHSDCLFVRCIRSTCCTGFPLGLCTSRLVKVELFCCYGFRPRCFSLYDALCSSLIVNSQPSGHFSFDEIARHFCWSSVWTWVLKLSRVFHHCVSLFSFVPSPNCWTEWYFLSDVLYTLKWVITWTWACKCRV